MLHDVIFNFQLYCSLIEVIIRRIDRYYGRNRDIHDKFHCSNPTNTAHYLPLTYWIWCSIWKRRKSNDNYSCLGWVTQGKSDTRIYPREIPTRKQFTNYDIPLRPQSHEKRRHKQKYEATWTKLTNTWWEPNTRPPIDDATPHIETAMNKNLVIIGSWP